MMPTLLPCPFCGFHAQLREYCNDRPDANHDLRWYVHCPGCGTEGATHDGQAVAVTAWNQRVQLECGWCRQDTMCNHRAKYGHCVLGDDPEKCLACPGER